MQVLNEKFKAKKPGKKWYKCKYCGCEYPTKKLIKMHEDDHQFCDICGHYLEFDEGFFCPNEYGHIRDNILNKVKKKLERLEKTQSISINHKAYMGDDKNILKTFHKKRLIRLVDAKKIIKELKK